MTVFGLVEQGVMKSEIRERLKKYSSPRHYASSVVEDVVGDAIRENHPEDYDAFVERHKGELRALKQRLFSECASGLP
jgi:hypothetical protein